MRRIGFLLVLVFGMTATQVAIGSPHGGKGQFSHIFQFLLHHQKELDLKADQVTKVTQLRDEMLAAMTPLKARKVKLKGELASLWIDPKSDPKAFEKASQQLMEVKQQKMKLKAAMFGKLRAVLTPAQWMKLPNPYMHKGFGPGSKGHGPKGPGHKGPGHKCPHHKAGDCKCKH